MQRELTLQDMLIDPLIALVREADGISASQFERLLTAASEGYSSAKGTGHLGNGKMPATVQTSRSDRAPEASLGLSPTGMVSKAGEPCLCC